VKLLRGEQYDEALTAFATAVDENPGDHRSAFGAGVAAEAAGKFDRALKFYQMAAQEQENRTYREARDRVKAYGHRAKGA
jgi:tetratricopeptide (TPR) repeat protein